MLKVVTTTDDGKPPETIEAAENAGSLTERKAEAAKKLAGASVESMLGAMEVSGRTFPSPPAGRDQLSPARRERVDTKVRE